MLLRLARASFLIPSFIKYPHPWLPGGLRAAAAARNPRCRPEFRVRRGHARSTTRDAHQIGIIGAGPAGLFLAHLLHRAGIEAVNVEARSRDEVEGTIRAGVLEHWVTELMHELGLGDRMAREGHFHDGITLQWNRARHHLDFRELTGGKCVTVYAQHEVLKDLDRGAARRRRRHPVRRRGTAIRDIDSDRPGISLPPRRPASEDARLRLRGRRRTDSTGRGRQAIPRDARREYQKTYPFGWLGILAEAPLSWHELIYANQADGFALLSTRSPEVQRLYVQCDPTDDLAAWPDARIWDALHTRLDTGDGWSLAEGPIIQKGIVPLRSFVCEPMQHGRLFLAGDAAHIVPPTGAKGLNLAVADVSCSRARSRR